MMTEEQIAIFRQMLLTLERMEKNLEILFLEIIKWQEEDRQLFKKLSGVEERPSYSTVLKSYFKEVTDVS